MADQRPWLKSEDASAISDSETLKLPTPPEPLRESTEQNIDPAVMLGAIEAMIQIARLQPDFEERRLARKTAVRFRY
jgi:hypothetical protein